LSKVRRGVISENFKAILVSTGLLVIKPLEDQFNEIWQDQPIIILVDQLEETAILPVSIVN
jgi:hypothetical protein